MTLVNKYYFVSLDNPFFVINRILTNAPRCFSAPRVLESSNHYSEHMQIQTSIVQHMVGKLIKWCSFQHILLPSRIQGVEKCNRPMFFQFLSQTLILIFGTIYNGVFTIDQPSFSFILIQNLMQNTKMTSSTQFRFQVIEKQLYCV